MSKRTSTARYTLPLEVDPSSRICFQIEVPNDIYHIGAFLGQIYALSRAYSWGDDTAHTAKDVAAIWRDIFDNLLPGCPPPAEGSAGAEGDEQLIRQNPTNPCLFETSINGTDWCVFADISKCVPAGGQPGSGSQQPAPGGGQQCYQARMQGSGKWLLPYQVSAGDVIAISDVAGAATDGSGIWYCGNGQTFFAGFCAGATTTSGSDPKPASPHMRLIAKIAGVYYEAYNTSITVPGGVSNANVEFQLNDASLSDNFGELTWKACVTNNATAVFSHTFDFRVTDGGFSGVAYNSNDAPTYIPGTGWDSPDETNAAGVTRMLVIKRTGLASRTYTGFTAEYTVSSASGTGTTEGVLAFPDEAGGSGVFFQSQTDGNGSYNSGAGLSHADTSLAIRIQVDATNGSTVAHAHIVLTKLTITGLGADPF